MRTNKIDKVIEDPFSHIGKVCHVQGWNTACVFRLENTNGNSHVLITPKTGRIYRTDKPLLYTRGQMQQLQSKG